MNKVNLKKFLTTSQVHFKSYRRRKAEEYFTYTDIFSLVKSYDRRAN